MHLNKRSQKELKVQAEKRQQLIEQIKGMIVEEGEEVLIDLNWMVAKHFRNIKGQHPKQKTGENKERSGHLFDKIRSLIIGFAGESQNREKLSLYAELMIILSELIMKHNLSSLKNGYSCRSKNGSSKSKHILGHMFRRRKKHER